MDTNTETNTDTITATNADLNANTMLWWVFYGKREADAYTIGQVVHGLPLANAYATGHPHNVGLVTGVGYSGYGHGYGAGVFYGKREAEAYTIRQVAYGEARGVVTGVDYGDALLVTELLEIVGSAMLTISTGD